jgi:septal ring factor EnvC (AmiA/AmiB activator)
MTLDSTIVATLIAIAAGAIGSLIGQMFASQKSSHELEKQDIRTMEAIKRIEEKLLEVKADLRETGKEMRVCDRELEKAIEESDRRFRSLVNFLAGKGLHYRVRDDNKGTLS